jgi:four helix bundle protein
LDHEVLRRLLAGTPHAVLFGMPNSSELVNRVHEFALAALKFYDSLSDAPRSQIPGKQFYRAATAIEANYRAAKRGRSRSEFIAKLGTVVEEADEAVSWLEHMRDGRIAEDPELLSEAQQLRRIFAKSVGTARANARRAKAASSKAQKLTSSSSPDH